MAKIRTFICTDLPEEIRKPLNELKQELKLMGRGVRWVKPEGMHLTLKFLGDTETDQIDEIEQVLLKILVNFAPMRINVRGLGAFPNYRNPRVFWVGMEENTGELVRLVGEIEKEMKSLGFPEEKRAYSPHFTLGRIKMRNTLTHIINHMQGLNFDAGSFIPANIIIMQSDLKPDGAIYTPLRIIPFK